MLTPLLPMTVLAMFDAVRLIGAVAALSLVDSVSISVSRLKVWLAAVRIRSVPPPVYSMI